jgi:cytochrome c-type biogenesis protein CcmE
MSKSSSKYLRFGVAVTVILMSLGYLAFTGIEQSKSYYVTIKELRTDTKMHSKRLRVAGNVQPGSIKRQGTRVEFTLVEEALTLPVVYKGTEAPPDTFKDESQALVEGQFGSDGIFRANHLQAKCASKYAPKQEGSQPETAKPLQKAEANLPK